MKNFQPRDPNFRDRVRHSFERQPFMKTLGADLVKVEPGFCEIRLAHRPELEQQHGFMHAGAVGAIADSAGGYAAYTLMDANDSVLSVEYKLNLLEPAQGEAMIARAEWCDQAGRWRSARLTSLSFATAPSRCARRCSRQ